VLNENVTSGRRDPASQRIAKEGKVFAAGQGRIVDVPSPRMRCNDAPLAFSPALKYLGSGLGWRG
jgi:hypothetical protein